MNPSAGSFSQTTATDMDEREEHGIETPSNDTDLQPSLPPRAPSTLGKRKSSRLASYVWDHFTLLGSRDDPDVRCKCNYCEVDYACGTKKCGTSTLSNHLTNQCKKYPGRLVDKKQKILSFETKKEGSGSNLVAVGQSKEECRVACAKMVVLDELPFRFVEGRGFRFFCSVACPQFRAPSRRTLMRDIYQLYLDEKLKLRDIFSFHRQRVSLTTDTWTSIQNVNYMSLTAHFIDSDWTLNKRILSFCVVPNHKGETIGKMIETCLQDWGIEKVFTITVDNASSNDVDIAYLRRKLIA
ncbi:zinc finger BED domain-containing protein RICESLEEPER 4-like [Olea europaea var. sylvestris]|uniref:zinc finger BED domain-containing protein RICESLEEPER 4-like n=1 Tax=Olea europaea var. sylvestris TaxID=158386 RepID=UPI000C1D81B6|nr:zinc finger BED domain-containing protein RICESLEEPER 4-like [Olea europaea var. sylvestris]